MTDVPHVCLLGPSSEDIADRYAALLTALAGAGARVSVVSDALVHAIGVEASNLPAALLRSSTAQRALVPVLVARWSVDRPTLVHILDLRIAPAAAAAAAIVGVPFRVLTLSRTFEASRAGRARFAGVRDRLALARMTRVAAGMDRFVAMHQGAKSSWGALGVASADETMLLDSGMGVDVEWLIDRRDAWRKETRANWGCDDQTPVVVYVDDLRAPSDKVEVAAIFKRIRYEVDVKCRFGVCGPGGPEGAESLPTPEARQRWLAGADLVLSVAREVEQAVSVQEAAALSVPAVVSDVRGHVEVVRHNHTGVVVRRGDLGLTAAACLALLNDSSRLEALGSRARAYAARLHDRDLAVQKVLRLYDQLLGGPQPEPVRLTPDGKLVGESGRDLVD
jgi:glycosyltransferase involved in cell wall biosynthesis